MPLWATTPRAAASPPTLYRVAGETALGMRSDRRRAAVRERLLGRGTGPGRRTSAQHEPQPEAEPECKHECKGKRAGPGELRRDDRRPDVARAARRPAP